MLKSASLVLAMSAVGLLGCEEEQESDNVSEIEAPLTDEPCCEAFNNVGGCNAGGQHSCCPFPPWTQLQCMEDCGTGEYYSCRNEGGCYQENWMGEGGCNSSEESELCREACEMRCSTGGFCDTYRTGNYCICWGSDPEEGPPPI